MFFSCHMSYQFVKYGFRVHRPEIRIIPKKKPKQNSWGGGRRGKVHISEMKAKLSLSWTWRRDCQTTRPPHDMKFKEVNSRHQPTPQFFLSNRLITGGSWIVWCRKPSMIYYVKETFSLKAVLHLKQAGLINPGCHSRERNTMLLGIFPKSISTEGEWYLQYFQRFLKRAQRSESSRATEMQWVTSGCDSFGNWGWRSGDSFVIRTLTLS